MDTEALVKEMFDKHEICYAYNDFGFYREGEMTKEECIKFCNKMNECKGGHYVVHPKGQYHMAYEDCFRHGTQNTVLENLRK